MGLNLRIVSGATTELGLETHVCELQLLLRPYAELKVAGGYTRDMKQYDLIAVISEVILCHIIVVMFGET